MNTAKTRALIIGGALLVIVAMGAFWLLPKNEANQNGPENAASDTWNQPADTAVTPDTNTTDTVSNTTDEGQVAGVAEYVVAPDDSLSTIAQKFYGDSSMYWLLEWYNEETLAGNIDHLTAGTKLTIPDKAKANQPKPGTEKPNTQQQPQTGTEKPNTQTPSTQTPSTNSTNPSTTTPGR